MFGGKVGLGQLLKVARELGALSFCKRSEKLELKFEIHLFFTGERGQKSDLGKAPTPAGNGQADLVQFAH